MVKIDILSMAYKNLMRRKARTFLTVLGVLIGTTSIIVMISLGLGLSESQRQMMEQWGSLNEVEVQGGGRMGQNGETAVLLDDKALDRFLATEGVVAVSPQVELSAEATWGKLEGYLQIYGVTPENMEKFNFKVSSGRLLQEGDRNVIVVGNQVSDQFYDPNDTRYWENYTYDLDAIKAKTETMLGLRLKSQVMNYQTQQTRKLNLEVVGVLESGGRSYYAYMPIDEAKRLQKFMMSAEEKKNSKKSPYSSVTILTSGVEYSKAISKSLTEEGYYAYTIADQLEGVESQSKMIQAVLGGIGAITLLVAAIGIINTMIMSIYERTREIGIMKVIGATFSDIRLLFLTEAGLIGLFGGILGLGLSFGLSHLLNVVGADYMKNMTGTASSQLSLIPPWLAIFAIVFSIMIGVLAGLYPANRAVKLSPIEAMRNNG